MRALSRRDTLALGASGAALTLMCWGESASAAAKEAAEQIAKFTGGKTAEKGKISIELPRDRRERQYRAIVGISRRSDGCR